MDKAKVTTFAKKLGLSKISTTQRTGYIVARCPFARWLHEKETDQNPSFAIRYGKKKPFFHCFSCLEGGDLDDLLLKLAVRVKGNKTAGALIKSAREYLVQVQDNTLKIGGEEDEVDEVDEIVEWPEWYISSFQPAYAHPYLAARKGGPIPEAVAKIMDFRWDAKRQRLGVPIRDYSARLMGFHGRTTGDHPIKYMAYKYQDHWNRPVWLGEQWIDLDKPVLIVESVFDMARALQVYRNTISPLMAGIPPSKIARIGSAVNIVAMLDPDKAGQLGLQRLKQGLPDSKIAVPSLPHGLKDPGDAPVDVLAEVLEPFLKLDSILVA